MQIQTPTMASCTSDPSNTLLNICLFVNILKHVLEIGGDSGLYMYDKKCIVGTIEFVLSE